MPNTVWYNYRRVPAVTLIKHLLDEGQVRADLPLPRQVPAGLDDLAGPAAGRRGALAPRRLGRRQRRHGRPARPQHRHGAVAERPDHRSDGDDRNVHQGAEAQPDGQGSSRSASTTRARFSAGSRTARWRRSRRRATRAATRRSTRSRSTASTRRRSWDLHDLHRIQYFDHRDEGRVRGWRNVHVTDGDQPYMKHWWVPGLQIGYEHTFIHQFADFVHGGGEGQEPRADVPRRPGDRLRHRRRPRVGEAGRWEQVGSTAAKP